MYSHLKLKNKLKYYRVKSDLTQVQLAEIVGVSKNTISSIETGQFCPTAHLAARLCLALNCKFEELFYISSDQVNNLKDVQKMKNKHAQDLNVLKMIKSLSQGKCAVCVFNKLGTCSLLSVHQVGYDDPLSDKDVMDDKFKCKYKILHQDLSDFMVD